MALNLQADTYSVRLHPMMLGKNYELSCYQMQDDIPELLTRFTVATRQIYAPNATSLATLCFVIVIVCPIPILFYVDSLQHGRYKKAFEIIEWVAVINLAVFTTLQFAEIADYLDTLFASQMIQNVRWSETKNTENRQKQCRYS